MNELRVNAVTLLLVSVITTIQLFSVLTASSYQLTEDAWLTELVVDCELWERFAPFAAHKDACTGMSWGGCNTILAPAGAAAVGGR
jgi:hypothetical protein